MADLDIDSVENYTIKPNILKLGLNAPNSPLENTYNYTPQWNYFKTISEHPIVRSILRIMSIYTLGKSYKADTATQAILDKIDGKGKEIFESILYNMVFMAYTCGDAFAEIVRDDDYLNLKPLNPGRMQIVTDDKGFITGYKQLDKNEKPVINWKPEEIFHISFDRFSDLNHGESALANLISMDEKKQGVLEQYEQGKNDLAIVFRRYVKPLIISTVDTDDEVEIMAYKKKLEKAIELGENMVVPKSTVESIEKVSIPQFSTLDPMPWLKFLQSEILKSLSIPEVLLGAGDSATESTSKILYLSFQQTIEWNQTYLEKQIKAQLDLDIELESPADLLEQMQDDESKDGSSAVKPSDMSPLSSNK